MTSKVEPEDGSENDSDDNDSQDDDFRLINAFGPLKYEFNNKAIHERQLPSFDIVNLCLIDLLCLLTYVCSPLNKI